MKKNPISPKLQSIIKNTEDIDYLVMRLKESLKKDHFFYMPGICGKSPEKMTKQELIVDREALLFSLKFVNNQYVYELLNRITSEVSLAGRTGLLKALRVKGLSPREWIRLAMLQFNSTEDSKKMPHIKIAKLHFYPIEKPKSMGKVFISQIKNHLIEVLEKHIKRKLTLNEQKIILRIEPKSIRDMLKILN